MNIAICEDSMEMLGELEKIIYDCYDGVSDQFSCDTYLSGEELIKNIKLHTLKYQIYLLDIEMKEVNGLEVAFFIRETDRNAIIIFVTSHSELMQEAFEVLAFHYLVKPIDKQKTKQVLLRAIEAIGIKKNTFHYKVRKKINTLYFEQIEYFESYKRKIMIHSIEEVFEYYGTLKEVSNKVNDQLFVQVHNSYIVNMDFIKFVDAFHVSLTSGDQIPITKKYSREFNIAYRNYVLKRMM